MSCLAAQDGKLVANKVHSRTLSPSLCTRLSQILQTFLLLSLLDSCFSSFEMAPHRNVVSLLYSPPSSQIHQSDKPHLLERKVNVLFISRTKSLGHNSCLALCKETFLLTSQNKLWQASRDRRIRAGRKMANVSFRKQVFHQISPGYVTTHLQTASCDSRKINQNQNREKKIKKGRNSQVTYK